MDLTGWTYCYTFGHDLHVYGKGNRRVAIDGKSGRLVLSFYSTTDVMPRDEKENNKNINKVKGGEK